MAAGEDGFAGLYRAPAGSAIGPGGREGRGGHRRGDAHAGGDRAARAGNRGDGVPVRSRGWGVLPGRYGVLIMTAGAAMGAFATILVSAEPGTALGVGLVAGALAGAFAVHPRAAYRLIPVPAIAGFVAALLAGVVHDRAADTSRTLLAINAFGWMAGGFGLCPLRPQQVHELRQLRRDLREQLHGRGDEHPGDGPGEPHRLQRPGAAGGSPPGHARRIRYGVQYEGVGCPVGVQHRAVSAGGSN
jgi:hypothetical protein